MFEKHTKGSPPRFVFYDLLASGKMNVSVLELFELIIRKPSLSVSRSFNTALFQGKILQENIILRTVTVVMKLMKRRKEVTFNDLEHLTPFF